MPTKKHLSLQTSYADSSTCDAKKLWAGNLTQANLLEDCVHVCSESASPCAPVHANHSTAVCTVGAVVPSQMLAGSLLANDC